MRIMLTRANIVLIIISNIAHAVYMRFTAFWNFSKLMFVLHILAFTKLLLRWCAPWKLCLTLFKSSFPTLDTLCRLDLQCFHTFRNCCLFCAFWLIRIIYSGDAHDNNYCKHSLNNHFQYWTHGVYQIYRVFKLFETAVFSAPLGFYEISTVVMRIMLTRANIVLIIVSNIAHAVYIRFTAFWNFSKLQFGLHIFAFTKFLLLWCTSC